MRHRKIEFLSGIWWFCWKRSSSPCLDEGQLDGSCDTADKKGRKWIYVAHGMPPKQELETVIHECCHAADPRAKEDAIEDQARVISQLLYDLGWRKSGKKKL